MKRFYPFCIVAGGIFWGSMGLFVREFSSLGFSTLQIVATRLGVAAIIMLFFLAVYRPKYLKIKIKDFPLLACLGLCSLTAMSILYFTTIELTTMSAAAILLYLAPIIVVVLSRVLFKEKITPMRTLALVLAVFGCTLISGVGNASGMGILGVVTGIGSAVAYGLYSIIGTFALRRYHPFTVTFWAFTSAGVVMLLVCNPQSFFDTVTIHCSYLSFWLKFFGIGAVTAVIPYVLYTLGLKGVPAGKASILACSEPVAATVLGMVCYDEIPGLVSVLGMILVLTAILLLNLPFANNKK